MSIKDITDYVRLTPGNTNPSVIGSMVQSEVNGTLKESKAYTDQEVGNLKNSGGAGYVETRTLVDDGTKETIDLMGDGSSFAHLTEDVIDLSNAKIKAHSNGVVVPINDVVYANNGGIQVIEDKHTAKTLVVCFPTTEDGVAKGVYVLQEKDGYYSVTIETIHPIDHKFLPKGGVGYEESGECRGTTPFDASNGELKLGNTMMVGAIGSATPPKGTEKLKATITDGVTTQEIENVLVETGENYSFYYGGASVIVVYVAGAFMIGDQIYTATKPGCYILEEFPDSLEVTVSWETIHAIDPKFIPGAYLPIVELGTALLGFTSIEDFTEAEHAKLTEVVAMGLPVVIKDPTMSTVFNYAASEEGGVFWSAILSEEGNIMPMALYRIGDYWVVEYDR